MDFEGLQKPSEATFEICPKITIRHVYIPSKAYKNLLSCFSEHSLEYASDAFERGSEGLRRPFEVPQKGF
jgi:hypothetical protein